MNVTDVSKEMLIENRKLTFFNQRNRGWTHPYAYQNEGTLSSAGCGIFSLCHASQWLTGHVQAPEKWANFSCANGGRGDDGTDRPALLHALMSTGMNSLLGFRYEEDGLRNDVDFLYSFLLNGEGVALCNLRVGHIVALVAARQQGGVRQVLAIDSYSESADARVRDHVHEVVSGSEITYLVSNVQGIPVGLGTSYAAYWVDASLPRDFNLLYQL